jgi:hypothetical protein
MLKDENLKLKIDFEKANSESVKELKESELRNTKLEQELTQTIQKLARSEGCLNKTSTELNKTRLSEEKFQNEARKLKNELEDFKEKFERCLVKFKSEMEKLRIENESYKSDAQDYAAIKSAFKTVFEKDENFCNSYMSYSDSFESKDNIEMRLMIESFILDSFEATQEHFDAMEMCLDQCNTNEIDRNELKKANEDHTKVVADLRDELSEVATLVSELQDQIETERYVIALLTEEKDELDIQLKNEKKRFSDTQSLVSDLKNEIKELANLVENPQEENLNEELNEKLKEKEKQIEEMRKELEDIKHVQVADRRIDGEKDTKKVISDLRFELSEMVELLEEVKQREKETSTQIAQKESERELLIIQLYKKIEDLNQNHKEKKTNTSNDQQDMLKKIGHLQAELQEKKNWIQTLQNDTSNDPQDLVKTIGELRIDLEERDKLIKTLQSKDNVDLLNKIDYLQIELLGKDRRIKCLQNSNDGKEVDLKKALKTKSDLELEVGDLQRMMKTKEKSFTEALHNHSLDLIGVKSQVSFESFIVKYS